MAEEETKGQLLEKELLYKTKNLGESDGSLLEKASDFCDYSIGLLEKNGYSEFEMGKKYSPGDKFYYNNRGKALIMVTVGKRPIADGLRLGVSHTDSPRLDFKPNPLFEDTDMAYFKTHYYGGIKKYQWATIPLSLHGVIVLNDGSSVKVCIGEDEGDPLFCCHTWPRTR